MFTIYAHVLSEEYISSESIFILYLTAKNYSNRQNYYMYVSSPCDISFKKKSAFCVVFAKLRPLTQPHPQSSYMYM